MRSGIFLGFFRLWSFINSENISPNQQTSVGNDNIEHVGHLHHHHQQQHQQHHHHHNISELYQKYSDQFNLTRVRNKGAIGDAIDYLITQDIIRSQEIDNSAAKNHINYQTNPNSQNIPICQVSYDSIADDTYFSYLGDVDPPYDYNTCPVLYPRYHVAPVCEQQERDAGIPQMYQWEWTLLAAKRGHCKMPNTSPVEAAKSYLENKIKSGMSHRPISPNSKYPNDKPGRVVNILFLGLSFMGEPFLSLICKHHKSPTLVDGFADYTENDVLREIPILPRLNSTAKCTNPCEDCFKPELHPPPKSKLISSVKFPKSRSFDYFQSAKPKTICNPRMVVFQSSSKQDPEPVTVRICYQYTFNLAKNQQRLYSKLPCGFTWDDVDVIFTIHHLEEFNTYYYTGTGADVMKLPHVNVVHISDIYEGLLMKGMKSTYASHNLPPLDVKNMRGKPNDCFNSDVHLRQPGIPDFAVESWLSLFSTGVYIDCKPNERCSKYQKKKGVINVWA